MDPHVLVLVVLLLLLILLSGYCSAGLRCYHFWHACHGHVQSTDNSATVYMLRYGEPCRHAELVFYLFNTCASRAACIRRHCCCTYYATLLTPVGIMSIALLLLDQPTVQLTASVHLPNLQSNLLV